MISMTTIWVTSGINQQLNDTLKAHPLKSWKGNGFTSISSLYSLRCTSVVPSMEIEIISQRWRLVLSGLDGTFHENLSQMMQCDGTFHLFFCFWIPVNRSHLQIIYIPLCTNLTLTFLTRRCLNTISIHFLCLLRCHTLWCSCLYNADWFHKRSLKRSN